VTQKTHDGEPLKVALLTVHVDHGTMDQIRQTAAEMPWELVHVDYDNYFSAAKLPPLTQRAINAQACVAVVDFDEDPELALETAQFLRESFYHNIGILALSFTTDPDLLLRAMRSGYSEFLAKPFHPDDFAETLARLDARWATTMVRPRNLGKIFSFFGAKGGVGTTTLAVHLAMFLVALGKKVLLIDNHAQLGHVVLYLGMDGSNHHFYDLVQNVSRLDEDLLRGFIATHRSGLDVLSSPDVYGGLWKTDKDSVERTLEFLGTQYDFVLLDCEAIRDLSRYVDGLVQNEHATKKLQVVINRYSSHEAVKIEQIEKAVHLPIAIKISNSYSELVRSINIGAPVTAESKSDFCLQMTKWAAALAGTAGPTTQEPAKKRFALWK
jgi:pilus assembly protein CpaE